MQRPSRRRAIHPETDVAAIGENSEIAAAAIASREIAAVVMSRVDNRADIVIITTITTAKVVVTKVGGRFALELNRAALFA